MTAGAEAARARIRPQHRAALLALAAAVAASTAAASPATEQLERMANALRSLSYEGTLVYLRGNRLEALRVVHRVASDGGAVEEIVSLNGPVRSLVRDQDQVTCELPDSRPISARRNGIAGDLLRSRTVDPEALGPFYLVHPLGDARVAGRQTEVVGVIPRDELRYGYRFYLDRESGLPLKSDLMGQGPEPIEQIMFTSLTLLPESSAGATPGGRVAATLAPSATAPPGGTASEALRAPAAQTHSAWGFEQLPAGFSLVASNRRGDASGGMVEHLVLSDGLASVSVYIESGAEDGLVGPTRMGAIHAVGGRVGEHQVTVVGEVPAATVQAVLDGLRYQGAER